MVLGQGDERKFEIRTRVWKVYQEKPNGPTWRWRVKMFENEPATGSSSGISTEGAAYTKRGAKWKAHRAVVGYRRAYQIGRGEPVDYYFEEPEEQISDRDISRAAKSLEKIVKDLNDGS